MRTCRGRTPAGVGEGRPCGDAALPGGPRPSLGGGGCGCVSHRGSGCQRVTRVSPLSQGSDRCGDGRRAAVAGDGEGVPPLAPEVFAFVWSGWCSLVAASRACPFPAGTRAVCGAHALFSLFLRSPDRRSPRGAPGVALAPWRVHTSATVLCPLWTPPVLRHLPTLRLSVARQGQPASSGSRAERVRRGEESGLGHTAGAAPAVRGSPASPAVPGRGPGRACPGGRGRGRRGRLPSQPGRGGPRLALGHRRGLSVCPRLSESLLFSYFSILNRPKRNIYFNSDSPWPSASPGSAGARGSRDMPAGRGGRPRQRPRRHGHRGAR